MGERNDCQKIIGLTIYNFKLDADWANDRRRLRNTGNDCDFRLSLHFRIQAVAATVNQCFNTVCLIDTDGVGRH